MKKKNGFTLIELLVVISIISILIAILLPALASARQTAEMTACMSNERQQAVAVQIYRDVFDDYLPSGWGGTLYWFEALDKETRAGDSLFKCPSDQNALVFPASSGRWMISYGWNQNLAKTAADRDFPRYPDILVPSKKIMIADSFDGTEGYQARIIATWQPINGRHLAKSNIASIAWVDGHVTAREVGELNSNNSYWIWASRPY